MNPELLAEMNARRDRKREIPKYKPVPLDPAARAEDCIDLPDSYITQLSEPLQREIHDLREQRE